MISEDTGFCPVSFFALNGDKASHSTIKYPAPHAQGIEAITYVMYDRPSLCRYVRRIIRTSTACYNINILELDNADIQLFVVAVLFHTSASVKYFARSSVMCG